MRSILLMVAGVFMMLSALAHTVLGWSLMRRELIGAGAGDELIEGLGAGWHFGGAAMAAFGLIVLNAGLRLRRLDGSGVVSARVIGACYVMFGLLFFFLRHFNVHFLLFVGTGVLTLAPVLTSRFDAPTPDRRRITEGNPRT
jgi:hypothetical protein